MILQRKIYPTLIWVIVWFMIGNNIVAQNCAGSWALQRAATAECVSGQWVGQVSGNPPGCPLNPTYTPLQTNSFTFNEPVSIFSIDFRAFDGAANCPRMEIKVNGVFYPLSNANLSDFPPGSTCMGIFSTIAVTSDGYLTTSNTLSSQGRITISNVIASSVTVSTNDGNETVFSNPFACTTVPLNLIFFSGSATNDCKGILRWKSGIELNVKNIEVLRSTNGAIFNKVADISPKGDDSYYLLEIDNREDAFFRLKIIDLDGSYEYSDIIKVKSVCTDTDYKILPNPVNELMEIIGLQKNDKVSIKNTLGQTVLILNSSQSNSKFNLQKLPPGIYFAQIYNANEIMMTLKIIKK